MLLFVGKGHEFGFYRGAIAWPGAFDLAIIERRVCQSCPQGFMHFAICEARPAGELFQGSVLAHIRELMEIFISRLFLHVFEVYAALVYANRRARFHSF